MNTKPEKLYKYVSLDVLKIILKDHTLKFSAPSDFNDPFDCDIDLVDFDFADKTDPQVDQEINKLKIQYKYNQEFNSKVNDERFWNELYKGGQIQRIKSSRICCFSLQNDIVLMWSHYADKHNGVCLEFDNTLGNRFVDLADNDIAEGEVGYAAHEKINYVSMNRPYAFYKLFLSKAESWAHEREFRLILMNNKPEIQKFNPLFLTSIYFGIKFNEDQINLFLSKINLSEFEHLQFYRSTKKNLAIWFHKMIS